jgi:hypothetical protein
MERGTEFEVCSKDGGLHDITEETQGILGYHPPHCKKCLSEMNGMYAFEPWTHPIKRMY